MSSRMIMSLSVLFMSAVLSRGAVAPYHSPEHLAVSSDGAWLAVSDATAGNVVLLDGSASAVKKTVALKGTPRGVVWHNGLLYVAEYDAGTVAEVDPVSGSVKRRIAVGPKPWGLAVSPASGILMVAEFGLSQLIAVDLASGKETGRVPVLGLPRYAAVTPDGSLCLVVNSAPVGDARNSDHACALSVVDLKTLAKTGDILLPPGSTNPRNVAISPDGKWAYVVHGIGRFTLPTTQLERGWIMTSGLTIIDMAKQSVYASLLLDTISQGAADPWGFALMPDGRTAWITLAGCNELVRLNLESLHLFLAGKASRADLVNDLAALYISGAKTSIPLPGRTPRGVVVLPSGKVAVAEYFSGTLAVVDARGSNQPPRLVTVSLGTQPEADAARRGEAAFHSADLCFQRWLSCSSCHPEGRADGLNWDLLNDGIGNPKNAKSMVWSARTPPVMAHGVRASMDEATRTGFMFIQFRVADEAVMDDVRAYLRSLEPEKSPYLVNGALSATAKQGKAIFETKAGCVQCHSAPLYTCLKSYDVGTRHEADNRSDFDTPTCIEMWRSGPYLHDGSAATLLDMITTGNKGDKHGVTSRLSKDERDALVMYLLSL